MSDKNVHLVIAAFLGEGDAGTILRGLRTQIRNSTVNAAVISKDAKGTVQVKATPNINAGLDIVIGCIVGAMIGFMLGPIVWDTIGGFIIGALIAMLDDDGFPGHSLFQMGEGLMTGSSAIIYVVNRPDDQAGHELHLPRTEVTIEALAVNIANHQQAGNHVCYSAIANRESFEKGQIVVLGGSGQEIGSAPGKHISRKSGR